MINRRKTIFDVLKEADDDPLATTGGDDTAENTPDPTANDEAPSPEESGDDASGDDYGKDDDFNIDTSLDAEGDGDDDTSGVDDSTSADTSDLGDTGDGGEEEPVPANSDIFASLTPEEQQAKIMELKRLFSELYSSTDDVLDKVNDTETDEDNIEIMSRTSMMLYSLRQYLNDYITTVFPQKSFIENDVAFNRFLAILNSISVVIEEIGKKKDEKMGKSEKK